jgi:hypothetical protein
VFNYRDQTIKVADDLLKEAKGKRVIIDKATGKPKEVDIYDRPEPTKKKADPERQRAMLSSNIEQSLIPEGLSKSSVIFTIIFWLICERAVKF